MSDKKEIINCEKCGGILKFREWSDRLPKQSEALAVCDGCGQLWQIRYYKGVRTSDPYQVRQPGQKLERGSYRVKRGRKAAIEAMYGSVQFFIDYSPLVCMSLQDKT